MAGLRPGHPRLPWAMKKDVDARDKRGHDDKFQSSPFRDASLGAGPKSIAAVFKLETKERTGDHIFGSEGAKVLIDPKSFVYLDGLTLDYKESLIQSGFVIENPNAAKTCSCGTSFSVQ